MANTRRRRNTEEPNVDPRTQNLLVYILPHNGVYLIVLYLSYTTPNHLLPMCMLSFSLRTILLLLPFYIAMCSVCLRSPGIDKGHPCSLLASLVLREHWLGCWLGLVWSSPQEGGLYFLPASNKSVVRVIHYKNDPSKQDSAGCRIPGCH